MQDVEALIRDIEAYCREHALAESTFGRLAVGNSKLMSRLRELAAATGVRLHVVVPPRDGFLTEERVAQVAGDLRSADVWFCGPRSFGDAMRKGLARLGLPARNFHQEAFQMR